MQALVDAVLLELHGTLLADPAPRGAVDAPSARLRDGAGADLAWLARQVRVGVISSTPPATADDVLAVLEQHGLGDRITTVVTTADGLPDRSLLTVAAERLGVADPDRLLYVGVDAAGRQAAVDEGLRFACAAGCDQPPAPDVSTDGDVEGFSAAREDLTETPAEADAPGLRAVLESWLERAAGDGFEAARSRVAKSDIDAANAAAAQQARLAKPLGSLGRLEPLATQLAAIAGHCPPPVPDPATVVVFAADHGIAEWDVSPRPRGETARLLATAANGTAAVDVLARQVGARVIVVDVGVAVDEDDHGPVGLRPGDDEVGVADDVTFLHRSIRPGTRNLAAGPAMTRTEVLLALDVGAECARRAVAEGAACLITGDIGVGASTPATAIIAAITNEPPAAIVGRGSGADDEMLARKVAVVEAATEHLSSTAGPLTMLAEIGGFEIAALAGLIVGAAAEHVPVIIDGVIADAAALVATALAPDVIDYLVAGHRQGEPAADAALAYLGMTPLLDIGVRLGEGAGALLALPIVQSAAHVLAEMATVAEMAAAADMA